MNLVVGRILTGICGGLVMAGINHWNSLTGWAYAGSIATAFIAFLIGAVLLERANVKKTVPKRGLGSFNEAIGDQEVEIKNSTILPSDVNVGSCNKAGGNQKIRVE